MKRVFQVGVLTMIAFALSMTVHVPVRVDAQSTCSIKADGNYHCGENCNIKADGKFHCGHDCSIKGDGKFHCIGDGLTSR